MHRRSFLTSLGTGAMASTAGCLVGSIGEPHPGRRPEEVLGIAHVDGRYHLTDDPFLTEGARTIAELGSNVLRLWLDCPTCYYPYNHDWQGDYDSMVDIATEPGFREVFEMDFSTYFLKATAKHRSPGNYYREGLSGREANQEEQRFEAFTRHLLETYGGTGKTFVLQDSEVDYVAVPDDEFGQTLDDAEIRALRRWYEARQAGVEAGRDAVDSDVTVLHAAELSIVLDAKNRDADRVVNRVLPAVDLDLVGYSAYELGDQIAGLSWLPSQNGREQWDEAEQIVTETLDYIADQHSPTGAADSVLADGQAPLYIGEFGVPIQEDGRTMRSIRTQLEAYLSWGVRWAVFWQVYGNEFVNKENPVGEEVATATRREQLRGFYLVRPDGSRAPTWDYFQSVFDRDRVGSAE